MQNQDSLPPGYMLIDEYRVQKLLGSGGFANTYLARDLALDRNVAIKEYFPRDYAVRAAANTVSARSSHQQKDFLWGLDRFAREAKIVSKLKHANIVRVFRVFNALNTAYIVLEFVDGADLEVALSRRSSIPQQTEIDHFLERVLEALAAVHAENILHRDIKPANIFLRRADGAPVLIDFGASKFAFSEANGTTAAIVSRGFSPQEAYATDAKLQGPWTDIYSLGATLYFMLTNRIPPESTERVLSDKMIPARNLGLTGYRESFLAGIDWSLKVQPSQRPRTVAEWRAVLLYDSAVPVTPAVTPRTLWWRRVSRPTTARRPVTAKNVAPPRSNAEFSRLAVQPVGPQPTKAASQSAARPPATPRVLDSASAVLTRSASVAGQAAVSAQAQKILAPKSPSPHLARTDVDARSKVVARQTAGAAAPRAQNADMLTRSRVAVPATLGRRQAFVGARGIAAGLIAVGVIALVAVAVWQVQKSGTIRSVSPLRRDNGSGYVPYYTSPLPDSGSERSSTSSEPQYDTPARRPNRDNAASRPEASRSGLEPREQHSEPARGRTPSHARSATSEPTAPESPRAPAPVNIPQ